MCLQNKTLLQDLSRRSKYVVLLLIVVLSSCTTKKLKGEFDSEKWKSDQDGCKGVRTTLLKQIETVRLELIGVKEFHVRGLFGKPDAEELMENSMKKYIYYITPGPKCNSDANQQSGDRITYSVTINAVGKVTESIISSTSK